MIDTSTYKKLHSSNLSSGIPCRDDMGPEAMAREEPPVDDTVLLFPSIVTGYNMRLKKWSNMRFYNYKRIEANSGF